MKIEKAYENIGRAVVEAYFGWEHISIRKGVINCAKLVECGFDVYFSQNGNNQPDVQSLLRELAIITGGQR